VILAEKGATDPAYEAALNKVTDLKAIQDNVGRSKGDALRAVDDVRIAYKKVVASKGKESAEAIAAKRKMVSMEKALAEIKNMGPEGVEPKALQEAKRAIELIERQRLYAELRHRERYMWNKDIDTKTDLYVKELMNKQLNSTIDVFKDDLKQRLDLNDTQIAAKVKIHLIEQGYASTSSKGQIVAAQWTYTYRYMNISQSQALGTGQYGANATGPDGRAIDLVEVLTKRLSPEVGPSYFHAYRPLKAYEFEQEARKKCALEAKRVMSVKMTEMEVARIKAKKSKREAKIKMEATLNAAADKRQTEIDNRVKKMWEYISANGSAKLKKDFKFAMDNKSKADLAVKNKEEGALATAGNANKDLQKQIDFAANSFSDSKGADLMTSLRLEIAQLKNPPAKAGEFDVNGEAPAKGGLVALPARV